MDPEDLQQLIDDHYQCIRRAALGMCGDPWEADEIAQETFLVAMKAAKDFRGDSSASTWLYGICVNVRRSRIRSTMRSLRRISEWTKRNVVQSHCEPDESQLENTETRHALWQHVRKLSPNHRDVIVLRYSEDLSLSEVAAVLKCPEGTVKSRLHLALKKLRQQLPDESIGSDVRQTEISSEIRALGEAS